MMPKSILLVEDNLTDQNRIGKQLESLGFIVEAVAEGESAVQRVGQKQYDIILIDCQLPGIDGFEAASVIRQQEQFLAQASQMASGAAHPAVIIAMTESEPSQEQARSIAVGMNDSIQKPIQPKKLEELMKHWMQKLQSSAPSHSGSSEAIATRNEAADRSPESELDLHYLHQLSDHSPEFELELLQIFLQDSYEHLEILRQAIAQQDYRAAEQAAHHLRGSSANIGAKSIQLAAAELEEQAYQQQFQSIEFLLEKIGFSLHYIQNYVAQAA